MASAINSRIVQILLASPEIDQGWDVPVDSRPPLRIVVSMVSEFGEFHKRHWPRLYERQKVMERVLNIWELLKGGKQEKIRINLSWRRHYLHQSIIGPYRHSTQDYVVTPTSFQSRRTNLNYEAKDALRSFQLIRIDCSSKHCSIRSIWQDGWFWEMDLVWGRSSSLS